MSKLVVRTAVVLACGGLLPGCGEPTPMTDSADMPPPEWRDKFEREHPEAFKVEVKNVKKGKKAYQEVGPKERISIFIREYAKSKGRGQ
jgi:hypothetical protein